MTQSGGHGNVDREEQLWHDVRARDKYQMKEYSDELANLDV